MDFACTTRADENRTMQKGIVSQSHLWSNSMAQSRHNLSDQEQQFL